MDELLKALQSVMSDLNTADVLRDPDAVRFAKLKLGAIIKNVESRIQMLGAMETARAHTSNPPELESPDPFDPQ